jgi:hypothetical protein
MTLDPQINSTVPFDVVEDSSKTEKQTAQSVEAYKHLGFYSAIHEYGNKAILDELVSDNNLRIEAKKQDVNERFRRRIAWLEDQLTELENRLQQERGNKDTLKRLEEIRAQLLGAYEELGKEKRNLIEKRLDEFSTEIKKLFSAEGELYDEWRKINKKAFDDNQPRLSVLKARAEQLRQQFSQRNKEVNEQIHAIEIGGIDSSAFQFLLGKGIALVAGWFFSVFLITINFPEELFGQEDVWFFLLKSIFAALSESLPIAIIQVVGFISIIGTSAWICQKLLSRLNPDRNAQDINLNLENKDGADGAELLEKVQKRFQVKITSDSVYSLFLHAAPLLLTLGLVFVILKMGIPPNSGRGEIEKLDSSIEGQMIGTAIAFACASIMLLLFAKIQDVKKIIWANYILIGCAIFFPMVFLFDIEHDQRAIIGFVFSVLISASTIAYGIRYRGLRRISNDLESYISLLTAIIAKYSSPFTVDLHSKEFKEKIRMIQNDLLDWISGKNTGVRKMQDVHIVDYLEERNDGRVKRFLDRLFRRNNSKQNQNKNTTQLANSSTSSPSTTIDDDIKLRVHSIELDAFEKQNFPDYDKKIMAAKYEYDEIRQQNQSVSRRINELEDEIDEIIGRIFTLQKNKSDVIWDISLQSLQQKTWIQEGFELGLWYLKNDLFPERNLSVKILDVPQGSHTLSSRIEVILRFTLDEDFDEFKSKNLDKILRYLSNITGFGDFNFFGIERGSLVLKIGMSIRGLLRYAAFFDVNIMLNLRVVKVDYSSEKEGLPQINLNEDGNRLLRIKTYLKEEVAKDIKKGISETQRAISKSSVKYNDYVQCASSINGAETDRAKGLVKYEDYLGVKDKVANSLLILIDSLSDEDVNDFLGNANSDGKNEN